MNLSSVLIVSKKEKIEQIKEKIEKVPFCSVELVQDDKIVVIIESENLEDELSAYKNLEKLDDIISINMVFSYQDLDEEREKILKANFQADDFNEKLKKDNLEYYGNIYKKF
ncbi:periplasmic nitrate reductase assembly protein [Campylobacter volucris]|uniref:Chaperone NapD n=1 Tax=Campylobacter volucris TaxID=1031542 RepID=A0AAE6CZH8_9BACT|nr:chaperone NapD [Campylobacter volucris]AJC94292.1 periplasmic nitrate reductase assembly protein [Campylobacter volucris LMG 24379]KAB0580442.1 periplasmic nitrate reductase assembly protein [Campylobacter volucris]MBF7043156.1 periplasmic nitrate reductase assembly protein [Campylobacter volucris]MBF7044725.1 periplasmic nitrate reductase assembly protein [Campylobacter volucris]MBF7045105.1 periplasmic nitrate reductase assembly protein [Campylobacter volucris]